MNTVKSTDRAWEANVRRKTVRLGYWTFAWLVSMAVASFGPTLLWQSNELLTLVAIGVNLLIGLGMIAANRDHLESLDELQQKIHLQAMGYTLGVGVVAGLAYSNLDVADVISFDAEISHLVILMGISYLAAITLLHRKYR